MVLVASHSDIVCPRNILTYSICEIYVVAVIFLRYIYVEWMDQAWSHPHGLSQLESFRKEHEHFRTKFSCKMRPMSWVWAVRERFSNTRADDCYLCVEGFKRTC